MMMMVLKRAQLTLQRLCYYIFSLKRCVPENENQGEKNPEFLTFFLLFDNFEGLGVQFLPL
jgi:hypothetical protein